MLTAEDRKGIISDHQMHDKDSGSSAVQIAIATARINYLTEHLRGQKKDHAARQGLLKLVGRRNRLLRYLRNTDMALYEKTIKELKLRK